MLVCSMWTRKKPKKWCHDTLNKAISNFDETAMLLITDRPVTGQRMIKNSRTAMETSKGNRDDAVDVMLWVMYYNHSEDPQYANVVQWRATADGPEVLAAKNLASQPRDKYYKVSTIAAPKREDVETVQNGKEERIVGIVMDLLKQCKKTTRCYWLDENRKECKMDKGIAYEFCKPWMEAIDCDKGNAECQRECDQVTRDVIVAECDAACGKNGKRIMGTDPTDKFVKNCENEEFKCIGPCSVVPKSPTTRTTTTKRPSTPRPTRPTTTTATTRTTTNQSTIPTTTEKKLPLEMWEIVVIAVARVALLPLIIGLTICCLCKRKKHSRATGRPPPACVRGRATHAPAPPSRRSRFRSWFTRRGPTRGQTRG